MRALPTVVLAASLVARPPGVRAQTPQPAPAPSPYVPLEHWTMPFLEHLITAGVIRDPTPLTRPLRASAVLQALEAADTSDLAPTVRATIRRLRDEWRPGERGPHYRAELAAGAAAATQTVRDPLELDRGVPLRQLDRRAFGDAGLDVRLSFGPVIAVSHPVVDTRLPHDPDWYATTDNATRFAEAYVSGQWHLGELFFGILDRNWGPSGVPGVLLSANPYSMDHFAATLGTARVQLQTFATQLDTRVDTAGDNVTRYLVINRLWLRPPGRWTLGLWDAGVIAGVGRQLEPWFLNPASVTYFRGSSGKVNNFLGVDVERHGAATLFGQFMLDDIQVSRANAGDLEPASYAFTVGAKGRLGGAAVTWLAFYTQVANLAYRTPDPAESPLYFDLGTGRNFADYDQATAKLGLLLAPALLVEPEVTVLRQGEGDQRLPYRSIAQFPTTAVLFQGVVERLLRLALSGRWQLGGLAVTVSGGVHFLENADHVADATKTEWVGAVGVHYRFVHAGPLP
jgi:hypothetical protein